MNTTIDTQAEMAKLDRISHEYQKPDAGRKVDQKLISLLVGRAIPWMTGPDVIEMGSGDDQWTQHLIEHFGHSHLVDGSGTLMAAAKKKYGARLTTYHSLFEELNPGKQFDTVLCSLVLEHVHDPAKVLATAAQWLKPHGHLIAIVPNALSLHRRLAVAMGLTRAADQLGPSDVQLGHRWVFTPESMEAALAKAGLQILRKAGWFTKLLPQAMMTGFSDELLAGMMKVSAQLPIEHACFLAYDCRRAH